MSKRSHPNRILTLVHRAWPLLGALAGTVALGVALGGCALGDLGDVPVVCGDGLVEGSEECDDGNAIDGDGCSAQCLRVGTGSEGLCSNGLDDDSDTLFDCNDPDCAAQPACAAPPPETCANATDDDRDGQIDCADTDCTADPACTSAGESLCGNGRDDDGDGQGDCADADCDARACDASGRVCAGTACSCPGGTTESSCSDGRDDDCDGQLDCRDADCASDAACAEIEDDCQNGLDDDGDGQLDCADTNCAMEPCGPNGRRCQDTLCVCPGGGTETACQDGRDNDCDGQLDCADTDCAQAAACMQRESSCGDGIDNDSDELTDCADLDCDGTGCGGGGLRCVSGMCACPGGASESSCTDGADNDCDGQIDCADTDCGGESCGMHGRICQGASCGCPGGASEQACANSLDDDCDGLADCDDPDCSAATGCAEVTCDDAQDNDLDGDADCLDDDCDGRACGASGEQCAGFACSCPGGASESSCTNGVDDDCDGQLDCADSQCAADTACTEVCDIDEVLLCNFPVSHTTAGFGADVSGYSCGATDASGPERVYTFLATTDSTVTFRLQNPSADLDLYLLSAGGQSGCNPQGCLDASVATSGGASLTLAATAGTLYEVAVEGKAGASGTYDLSFDCTGGTSCAASAVADCGFSEIWTTTLTDATDHLDTYACTGWDESGPEYAYLFLPATSGTATIAVDSSIDPLGADLDVFVLGFNGGVCDASQCLASGDTSASLPVIAGEAYLVVVDGYQGDSGDFSITFTCSP